MTSGGELLPCGWDRPVWRGCWLCLTMTRGRARRGVMSGTVEDSQSLAILCSLMFMPAGAQHVVYPALRLYLQPSDQLAKTGAVLKIASTESLYRVFERC